MFQPSKLAAILSATLLLLSSVATAETSLPHDVTPTREAQTRQPSSGFFDEAHRLELYEKSRLEKRRALLYSLALPGLGNFYAEQYALGAIVLSALVFSGFFLSYGISNQHRDLIWFGAGLAGAAYGGGAFSSILGVRSYNDRLRRGLHLDSHLSNTRTASPGALALQWQWRF